MCSKQVRKPSIHCIREMHLTRTVHFFQMARSYHSKFLTIGSQSVTPFVCKLHLSLTTHAAHSHSFGLINTMKLSIIFTFSQESLWRI